MFSECCVVIKWTHFDKRVLYEAQFYHLLSKNDSTLELTTLDHLLYPPGAYFIESAGPSNEVVKCQVSKNENYVSFSWKIHFRKMILNHFYIVKTFLWRHSIVFSILS